MPSSMSLPIVSISAFVGGRLVGSCVKMLMKRMSILLGLIRLVHDTGVAVMPDLFSNAVARFLESPRSCLPPDESQMVRPSDQDVSIPTAWRRPYPWPQMRRIHRSVLWFRRTGRL